METMLQVHCDSTVMDALKMHNIAVYQAQEIISRINVSWIVL